MLRKILISSSAFFVLLLIFLAGIWFLIDVTPYKQIPVYATTSPIENYEGGRFDLDSLRLHFGKDKVIPCEYELSILLALSHFPEMKDIQISFELTQSGAPMESTFDYLTLLLSGTKRKYRILLLDSYGTNFDPIVMRNLSLNSQVGIIAHELCHTIYYHDLNTLEIINWGLKYLLNKKFAAEHERNSDLLAIYKGFGWQLLEYATYIRTTPGIREWYESGGSEWLDTYYMTDSEILAVMRGKDAYKTE